MATLTSDIVWQNVTRLKPSMHAGINGTAHLSTKLCHASTESGGSNSLELISRGWSKSKSSESISGSRLKMFISTKCILDSFIPIRDDVHLKMMCFFFFSGEGLWYNWNFQSRSIRNMIKRSINYIISLCWELIFLFYCFSNFLIMPV